MTYIYPMSRFDLAQNMSPYSDDTGREMQPIIIGEERKPGSAPVPIIEYVYLDIIQDALNGNLTVTPFSGLIPPILFLDKNGVVPHNDSITLFSSEIEKALVSVPYEVKADAMKELAAMYLDKSPGKVMTVRKNSMTNTLIGLVSAKASAKYNGFLIIETLKKEMKKECGSHTLPELVRLDKKELIALFGDCREYEKTGASRSPLLNRLFSAYGAEKTMNAVTWEFTNRCYGQERCE